MYARSVLWSVREIERCIDRLDEESQLQGHPHTVDFSNRARTTLHELVEMIRTGSYYQPSDPTKRRDDPLQSLLVGMYGLESVQTEILQPDLPEGKKTLEALKEGGHIEVRHGEVFVPLRGGGTARNWPALLELLVHRFVPLIEGTQRLIQKLRADGANKRSTELQLVRSLSDRLELFRNIFRSFLSQLQIINNTTFLNSQIHRFLIDVVPDMFSIETQKTEELP
jgi:hypothetical protein